MIQEIAPHRFCNAYEPRPARAEDWLLCIDGAQNLLCAGTPQDLRLPRVEEVRPQGELFYAFSLDGQAVYLSLSFPDPLPDGFDRMSAAALRAAASGHFAWAAAVGGSLARWYRGTRFCGSCGSPMENSREERARRCTGCGRVVYPKICPAVIVAVQDADRLLMTRYANRSYKAYALVAGFNEIGESIEDTVHREVWEETGLHIKNLRFYRSQPWVFTDSLLMGFFAELEGSDRIRRQESELAEARWFHRQDLPREHSYHSLTGEMIELFRSGGEP